VFSWLLLLLCQLNCTHRVQIKHILLRTTSLLTQFFWPFALQYTGDRRWDKGTKREAWDSRRCFLPVADLMINSPWKHS